MSPCGLADPFPAVADPRISLPIAQAASSMTGRPCRRAIAHDCCDIARHAELMDAEDRAGPAVMAFAIAAGSMLNVAGSMSTNTGVAPQ